MQALHFVSGATDGIGRETALQLARFGAHVVVHGRDQAKATAAVRALETIVPGAFEPAWGDLSSLAEVEALAARFKASHERLDVLVNNAGVFMNEKVLSPDGFELTMAVNHFGPFALTHRLLPLLRAAKGRVVNVSSIAHTRGELRLDDLHFARTPFDGYRAYASSKLANVLFSTELARRLEGSVTVNALHPGVIATKLLRTGFGMSGANVESGAATSVFCATSPSLAGVTGKYFVGSRETAPAAAARDAALTRGFYEHSCAVTKVPPA